MPELLQRSEVPEVIEAPREQSSLVPPVPPEGLDTILYGHDERGSRADLRRQIAAMEAELGELFGSAFPRKGIQFGVPAPGGGPRVLTVDELERVRDSLASRLADVRGRLHDHTYVEERNRELIERMSAAPEEHKWVQVSNEDVGEPGCRHWHSRPRWGPLGMLLGWWRVKVSSGCPLAEGLRPPPDGQEEEATQAAASPPAWWWRRGDGPPPAPWGAFPLSEIVVLIGILLLVGGFFVEPPRGPVMIGAGLVLGSLAGLELSFREHLAGYRSHTMLLGGAAGVAVLAGLLALTEVNPVICLAAAAAVFGLAAWWLGGLFRRRSGGALFRVKG